jgi:hypothetical protein
VRKKPRIIRLCVDYCAHTCCCGSLSRRLRTGSRLCVAALFLRVYVLVVGDEEVSTARVVRKKREKVDDVESYVRMHVTVRA